MPVQRKTPPPPPPTFRAPPKFTPPPPYFYTPTPPPKPKAAPAPKPYTTQRYIGSQLETVKVTPAQYLGSTFQKEKVEIQKKTPPPPPPMFKSVAPPPPTFKPKPKPTPQPQPVIPEDIPKEDPGSNNVPPPVYSEPTYPATPPPPPPPPKIKVAPIDTVIFDDDSVPKEIIADLLFEDIGGQEILTVARHDTVNGQTVLYQPIKNINILQQQYNSANLLKLRDTSEKIFENFAIRLSKKIPQVGNGPDGSNVYTDADGNIIIEFISLNDDEIVDIQITSSGTIYETG